MFELITSESSYLRSLTVLVNYFMKSQELRSCMTSTEHHHLFSNVEAVRATSRKYGFDSRAGMAFVLFCGNNIITRCIAIFPEGNLDQKR